MSKEVINPLTNLPYQFSTTSVSNETSSLFYRDKETDYIRMAKQIAELYKILPMNLKECAEYTITF